MEEGEALLDNIPLNPNDYRPLLHLSPLVPTAEILQAEEWRIAFENISPLQNDAGTGNQNYSINLHMGFNDTVMMSLFISQADDPLNTEINGLAIRPANYWQSYGAAARWQALNQTN